MWNLIIIIISALGLILLTYRRIKLYKKNNFSQPIMPRVEKPKEKIPNEIKVRKVGKRINYKELKKIFSQAEMFFTKENLEESAKSFLNVLAIDSDHEEATNKLGLIYLKQGLPGKAEILFTKLTEMYPKNAIYFSNLGLSLYQQEKLEEAITSYVKAISLDKKRPARYLSLAEVYKKKGEIDRVLGCYLEASALDVRNTNLLFAITDLYEEKGDEMKIQEFLNKILTYEPYNKEAKTRLDRIMKKSLP